MVFFVQKDKLPPDHPEASTSAAAKSSNMSANFQFFASELIKFCHIAETSNTQDQTLNASYLDDLMTYKKKLDESIYQAFMWGVH